jgi:hypothetical protein
MRGVETSPSTDVARHPSCCCRGTVAAYGVPMRAMICGVPVTVDEVRALAVTLPRSSEVFVRGRLKFRIGRIVYLSFSPDGTTMGFGFPKEWRDALIEAEPEKFSLPDESDLRFQWVHVRLAAIDSDEMRELVEGAWAMVVPKRVAAAYAAAQAD